MGLPVTMYRGADLGAPIIRPTSVADWLIILKACLVDGYGTKAALGWTLEFEDVGTGKAVFKNKMSDGGSGGAFQYEPNVDPILGQITCANEILGLDNFVKKVGYRCIVTSTSASAVEGWMIIGTSRGFWLIQEIGDTGGNTGNTNNLRSPTYAKYFTYYFIGDIDTFIPNDLNIFTLVSTSYTSNMVDLTIGNSTINLATNNLPPAAAIYNTDGSNIAQNYDSNYSGSSQDADEAPTNDVFSINTTVGLGECLMVKSSHSIEAPCVRGKIPGLFRMFAYGYRNIRCPILRTIGTNNYRLVNGYKTASWFIQYDGTWYE
jgi:hypothetical protein